MESLAIRYRPKTFDDVVGQENVIKILQNQIKNAATKQAYLMTGGAGTGKTTIARIFAKEINKVFTPSYARVTCPYCRKRYNNLDLDMNDDSGITAFTCKCGKVFSEDEAIDWEVYTYKVLGEIIEIDAASNNGVENVRDLRDTCKFKPITGGYKVYIIDEVHMLSAGAFNALLKTLEEPPAHAVFILCTTDPQKIPATILSRVQRFDFKRMTNEQIIGRLSHIIAEENAEEVETGCYSQDAVSDPEWAKKEGARVIEVEDSALEFIAKLANGGMRDSISLLDTCLGYKNSLTAEDIAEILGTANYRDYLVVLKGIHDKNGAMVIKQIEDLHIGGRDLKQFVKTMAEFVVEIRKYGLLRDFEYCNIPAYLGPQIVKVVEMIPDAELRHIFIELVRIYNEVKYETQPKTLIEGELICV